MKTFKLRVMVAPEIHASMEIKADEMKAGDALVIFFTASKLVAVVPTNKLVSAVDSEALSKDAA